jgi:hypothetical protein
MPLHHRADDAASIARPCSASWSPMPMHPRPLQKIVDERRWIAGAITLVVGRGASKEVASKVGLPVT